MKHLFTSIICLILLFLSGAPAVYAQVGGTDITVAPNAGHQHKLARVSVAYDGTIYVGRIFNTATGDVYNQWEVLKSTDKGATFVPFVNGTASANSYFTAFDMVAAGTDNSNFKLFVASATRNTVTGANQLLLTGYTPGGTAQNVSLPNSGYTYAPRGYASVALSTDSRDRNSEADPYSLALVATKSGTPADSVVAWVSNDACTSVHRLELYASTQYIRNVSASLGSTASTTAGYGTLGIVWEELTNSTSAWGTVNLLYVYIGSTDTVAATGPFQSPIGFRNPSLALSQNTAGSTDIRTLLLAEYKSDSEGTNILGNIIDGVLLSPPEFAGNPTVGGGPGGQINPHIVYDVINDTYLMTYYDSATHALVYKQKPFADTTVTAPTILAVNYRAAAHAMASPYPRVDMGSSDNNAVFVWNDMDSTLFDAELSYVSIQENTLNLQHLNLFPNPAQNHITLTFTATGNDNLHLRVVDMTGKTLHTLNAQAVAGTNQLPLALPGLAPGQYLIMLQGRYTNGTASFIISK